MEKSKIHERYISVYEYQFAYKVIKAIWNYGAVIGNVAVYNPTPYDWLSLFKKKVYDINDQRNPFRS